MIDNWFKQFRENIWKDQLFNWLQKILDNIIEIKKKYYKQQKVHGGKRISSGFSYEPQFFSNFPY